MFAKSGLRRAWLAVIATIVVVLIAPGAGLMPSGVSANVSGIVADDSLGVDNDVIGLTVSAEDDDGNIVITAGGNEVLSNVDCNPNCPTVAGEGTNSVTIGTADIDGDGNDDSISVTLDLTINCNNDSLEEIDVTATQTSSSRTVTVLCGDVDTDFHIRKQADNTGVSYDFSYSVSGGSCSVFDDSGLADTGSSGDFRLFDDEVASFACSAGSVVRVWEDDDHDLLTIKGCSSEDGVSVHLDYVLLVDVSDIDSSVTCTFVNEPGQQPVKLVLTASNTTPTCGTSMTITATVLDYYGSAIYNGLLVSFAGSPGSLNQQVVATVNGVASAVYTAPVNYNGPAVITANAGGAIVQGQIQIICLTPLVVAPAPPAPPPAPPKPLVVAPPSAGDGGLLGMDDKSFSYTLFAGLILIVVVSMGAVVATAKERADS